MVLCRLSTLSRSSYLRLWFWPDARPGILRRHRFSPNACLLARKSAPWITLPSALTVRETEPAATRPMPTPSGTPIRMPAAPVRIPGCGSIVRVCVTPSPNKKLPAQHAWCHSSDRTAHRSKRGSRSPAERFSSPRFGRSLCALGRGKIALALGLAIALEWLV